MIYDELIAKLLELPVNTEYPYVPSSTSSEQNKYKLLSVSFDNIKVERDGSEVSVSIQQIKTILENLRENKPLDIEKILGSSGNTRSIIESLLCLTPSVFYTKINRRKHIILLSELTHNLGSLTGIDENELSSIVAGEIQRHRIQMEAEFKNFLTSITKSKRTKRPLEPSAISSYLRFIKIDKLFDYDPSAWQHIESIYDIESVDEIVAIIKNLHENDVFVQRNLNDNKGWRAGSINQYRDFLIYKNQNISSVGELDDEPEESSGDGNMKCKQQIFFGAPGTGKSHKVNELVGEHESFLAANDREARFGQFSQCGCAKANHYADVLSKQETFNQDVFAIDDLEELKSLLESCDGDDKVKNPRHSALRAYIDFVSQPTVFRTTFHPDYDYAQFVGSYKPKKNGAVITYDFVPQVFAKAYKRAKETSEPVYLVIEEINRGNCAQIFGDIFQLLDRNESGESQYEIDVDSDFAEWLGESKIKLPANFNILATMNTSDQSLFPMDSAFKRRFDWEYVPIKYFKDSKCGESWNADKFEIKLDDNTSFSWLHFLKKINADIYKVTESEDKQMGEFFVKPKDGVIGLDMFRSKILFYLWDSVYKDEPDKKNVFHFDYPDKSGSKVTFQSLFSDDAKAIEIIKQMMKNLDEAYESKDDSEFKDFKILK